MCGGAVSCVLEMALGGGARTPPPQGQADNCQLTSHLWRRSPGGQRDNCGDAVPGKQSEIQKYIFVAK
jgi:hypothetical protein